MFAGEDSIVIIISLLCRILCRICIVRMLKQEVELEDGGRIPSL